MKCKFSVTFSSNTHVTKINLTRGVTYRLDSFLSHYPYQSSMRRGQVVQSADLPVVAWRGVGSNPVGDIYLHFEFPPPFRIGQQNPCKLNQAWSLT